MTPLPTQQFTLTFAPTSRHGSNTEWCSFEPTNTTGGSSKSNAWINLCNAPVHPLPAKITTSFSVAWTAFRIISRASCLHVQINHQNYQNRRQYILFDTRIRSNFQSTYLYKPLWSAVTFDDVCVFAYNGNTSLKI